jgi:hypothetical protein
MRCPKCQADNWRETASHNAVTGAPIIACNACGAYADEPRDLAVEISDLLEGLSPLEKALILAEAMREADVGRWVIDARADGTFVVMPETQ